MKILFLSFYFAPYNTMASIRLKRITEELAKQNIKTTVIAASRSRIPIGLEPPRDVDTIFTNWLDPENILISLLGLFGRNMRVKKDKRVSDGKKVTPSRKIHEIAFPDPHIGWLPFALSKIIGSYFQYSKYDYIYATCSPFTAAIIGTITSKIYKTPLIIEFRDLYYGNHGRRTGFIRKNLDRRLENWVVKHATALITINEPFKSILIERYKKPVHILYNGFTANLNLRSTASIQEENFFDLSRLNILYSGMIYPDFQDTELINQINDERVCFSFVGKNASGINIKPNVNVLGQVDHKKTQSLQLSADALIYFTWKNGNAIYSGKLLEYIGTARPIIIVGDTDKGVLEMLRLYKNKYVVTNKIEMEMCINELIEYKKIHGNTPNEEDSAYDFLRMDNQIEKLILFIKSLAR